MSPIARFTQRGSLRMGKVMKTRDSLPDEFDRIPGKTPTVSYAVKQKTPGPSNGGIGGFSWGYTKNWNRQKAA